MILKDYYKILELPPQASVKEIKKNFRRLALRYHPDTNEGNRYADAWYREIQEAYETLSDDTLRESYHQQRWLLKSQGRSFAETLPLTPDFILQQCRELKEQVRGMDHFRMSHESLQQQVLQVIRNENIEALHSFNEVKASMLFVQTVIEALEPLEYPLLEPVIQQLHGLSVIDSGITTMLESYLRKRKQQHLWQKYQGLVFLMITLAICMCIFYLGR